MGELLYIIMVALEGVMKQIILPSRMWFSGYLRSRTICKPWPTCCLHNITVTSIVNCSVTVLSAVNCIRLHLQICDYFIRTWLWLYWIGTCYIFSESLRKSTPKLNLRTVSSHTSPDVIHMPVSRHPKVTLCEWYRSANSPPVPSYGFHMCIYSAPRSI